MKKNIKSILVLLITSFLSACSSITTFDESKKESTPSTIESIVESLTEGYSSSEIEIITETITETISSFDSSLESESSSIVESSSSDESSSGSEELEGLDQTWSNSDYGTYYSSIDLELRDTQLLTALQKLNKEKRRSTVGYKNMWSYFDKTDYDPNNKSSYLVFYRGTSAKKSEMNKEHVWPKSRGGNKVDGDIHMVRPTLTSDNSGRGNSFYVEGLKTSQNGWDPKTAGMNEVYRGIAARIIFYCCVADSSLKLVDKNTLGNNESGYNCTMGKLSDLLKWNLEYEVQESELNRNTGAQGIQGNRNPFIDNPGFACAIWGGKNDKTKSICGR